MPPGQLPEEQLEAAFEDGYQEFSTDDDPSPPDHHDSLTRWYLAGWRAAELESKYNIFTNVGIAS